MSGRITAITATVAAAAKAMQAATEDLKRRAPHVNWMLVVGGPYIARTGRDASGWVTIVGSGGQTGRRYTAEGTLSARLVADPRDMTVRAAIFLWRRSGDDGREIDLGIQVVALDDGAEAAAAAALAIRGGLLACVETQG